MACKTSFELHHNFPKLAEEAGFTFNTHRPRVHIQWSKIKLIDIEDIVRNKNFAIVEQHLNDVLDCVIDLEFDVRILDDGFLKIFRLAQLAVEYQQFCRHYLDRSVFVLREEITSLLQELDSTKKALKDKEEESRKIKRKMKLPVRAPLPSGNDNIAKMILSALGQNKSELYPSSSQLDTMNYNKCNYCDKVFLNKLYLRSHITRRHGNVVEVPQKDNGNGANTNSELNDEIIDLKIKLKQMEELILNSKVKDSPNSHDTPKDIPTKDVRDVEVWTNNDLVGPSESRKKAEEDTYTKEINLLRTQILDIIKDKENHTYKQSGSELQMIEQLHTTIKNQGDEILSLKQELQKGNSRDIEERQKIEAQLDYWSKKAEDQSNDFKALLQKLNDVENEAREYRAKVESEKEKTGQLQILLQQHLSKLQEKPVQLSNKSTMIPDEIVISKKHTEPKKMSTSIAEHAVLKKLQERAQELLILNQLSSESSNISEINTLQNYRKQLNNQTPIHERNIVCDEDNDDEIDEDIPHPDKNKIKNPTSKSRKERNVPKTKQLVTQKKDVNLACPGSPIKVVRAKITEEVNNRLVSLGIDPLKKSLARPTYIKQRMLLQEQQDIKLKRFPTREKVVHSIMAHLETNASDAYQGYTERNRYTPPSKMSKAFSLSSVMSNVKTRALSMVKSNEKIGTPKKSYKDIARKASTFLKSSPVSRRSAHSSTEVPPEESNDKLLRKNISNPILGGSEVKKNIKYPNQKFVTPNGHGDSESSEEDLIYSHKINSTNLQNLIKSPVRKPSDIQMNTDKINDIEESSNIKRNKNSDDSSDGIESLTESPRRKAISEENLNSLLITKGVLKSATSTSTLNKKKVLFDMDAIQMKSVSASPSQSTTERSNNNEQYELGITNVDTEEWDLSSIENLVLPEISKEVVKSSTTARQSPKFLELKETIESKLLGRNQTLSTTPIGGVDVLSVPLRKGTSLGGSNTSLGSSILDDADSSAIQNHK